MDKLVQEATDRETGRAIIADEQANARYHEILRRFVSSKSIALDENLYRPCARLDASGLKEIDAAWRTLQDTGKNLRKAYMKLYVACV